MGRRPVEGYLHGRKGRVSAAVLPKGQQIRRTAQHPAHPRMRRYGTELAVRGHALRAVFLSNPVAVDRVAVSDHVPADVQLGHRTALQNAETATPVPDRKRQRPDLVHRRTRLLRRPAGLHSQLYPAQPDFDGQQHGMVLRTDYRLYHRSRRPVHHLRFA